MQCFVKYATLAVQEIRKMINRSRFKVVWAPAIQSHITILRYERTEAKLEIYQEFEISICKKSSAKWGEITEKSMWGRTG